MKTKTILTGIVTLAIATLLVACSNNKTVPTSNSSKTEQSLNKTNDLQTFIKENKKEIEHYREKFYLSGMGEDYSKLQEEAEKKGEQIYLTEKYVDSRLDKLKVKIGEYNSNTKRLEVIVTNNYSEDIVGYKDNQKNDIEHQTTIQIRGYFKEQSGIKSADIILGFRPADTIKSGESVTFHILMPYYNFENNPDNKQYENQTYDSMYVLNSLISNLLVFSETNLSSGREVMSNFDNFFISSYMIFKKYPKEASISDKEIVERYELMKK